MNILLKPFIAIYHGIQALGRIPKKLFHKTEEAVEQAQVNSIKKEKIVADEEKKKKKKSFFSKKEKKEKSETVQEVKQPSSLPPKTEEVITDTGIRKRDENAPERPLIKYRYVVINAMGKKENGTFEAESENEVRSFLTSQDYEIVSIKVRPPYDIDINDHAKIKVADLSFGLTQLSTYIKSGIPLVDAVKILAKQATKPAPKKVYQRLVYELLKGENLSSAMMKQNKVFPKLLVNMVKTAEMTGDLPSILDDMADYYTSMERTRKQMVSAMTYPCVVLTIAFGVLIFMLTYLVPQFATMFESNDAELPALTLAILGASDFIKENWIVLILAILGIVIAFIVAYKKVISFRTGVQIFLMHIPVVKSIIIYNEVANFTKTFASLLNHGVFITDSMEILSKITNNEVYKRIIDKTLHNLGKGDSISASFRGEWAFPVVAYEMLVTGESTGQLGLMMEKVADHFQALHKSVIDQLKSLMEPLMICALAVVVGIILLSIVQPMFSIYGQME